MSSPTALILAGGLGSRLASVHADIPKALVPISGQPFFHWLVSWLRKQGLSDFVFSLGYQGDQIEQWVQQTSLLRDASWKIYREPQPLGTGGAVRACLSLCRENLAVINGDSLTITPFAPALAMMDDQKIAGVIFGKVVKDASRYGTLQCDPQGFLRGFRDKEPGTGVISTGIMFLRRAGLESFPSGRTLSMENDVMSQLIKNGAKIKLYEVDAGTPFIDIGTPESLRESGAFIESALKPQL